MNFRRKLTDIINKPVLFKFIVNLWPPFLGCGIRVVSVSNDFRKIIVIAPLKWSNKTSIGWHFGGTFCSMVDPFYVFMINKHFGHRFFVCDLSMKIDYIAAGKNTVTAELILNDTMIDEIEAHLENNENYHATFYTSLIDENSKIITKIEKTVLIAHNRK